MQACPCHCGRFYDWFSVASLSSPPRFVFLLFILITSRLDEPRWSLFLNLLPGLFPLGSPFFPQLRTLLLPAVEIDAIADVADVEDDEEAD